MILILSLLLSSALARETELHWSVCEKSSAKILKKLDLKIKKEEERETSYLDTARLTQYQAGTTLRLRDSDEDGRVSTVKISFDSYPEVDASWYELEDFKCEEDLYGSKPHYSCSLDYSSSARNNKTSFSDDQREFIAEYANRDVEWDALKKHGPVRDRVWKLGKIDGMEIKLESMKLPDGSEFYELSTRVPHAQTETAHRKLSREWDNRDITLCDEQESKTKQVLDYFKAALRN